MAHKNIQNLIFKTFTSHQSDAHKLSDPQWRIRWLIRSSMPARARSARTNGPPVRFMR